eukprot:CAMPEP_0117025400 /NCGR_PEP_ID=MMETSP0472-20121206/18766_1 /TAXON_ID=693140 ORGANISM="Tiarina fusus, Strain LIS" /NCGR_SAMPLE_ID=MMETSP0472 /ASSEMBLY_ACC=CAM_ASM_000603 /LENGTH=204 /DNA_ID=CAMNT_0004732103 /DNA_START=60 /DNA_END=674 /DNA_ORIENTATION=-
MKYETESACLYWLSCLDRTKLTAFQIDTFLSKLQGFMRNKFANHWYEENPLQGQAFRSMVCDQQRGDYDQLLLDASAAAGFSFTQLLSDTQGARMWIDPGEVEVENIQGQKKRIQIYPERNEECFVEEPLYYFSQQFEDSPLQPPYYQSQSMNPSMYDQYSENFYGTIQDPLADHANNWNFSQIEPQGYESPTSNSRALFSVAV